MNRDQIIARLGEIGDELEQLDVDNLDEQSEARFDGLTAEADELRAKQVVIEARDAKRAEVREQIEAGRVAEEAGEFRRAPQHMKRVDPFDGDPARMTPAEARDKALATLESREHAAHLNGRHLDGLDRLLRARTRNADGATIARRLLVTEQEAYRSAFMKLVTRPNAQLTAEESRAVRQFEEFRDMNITTDADGGFGVPVLIDPTIILDAQGHPNDFFRLCRVETVTTETWKGVSSAGVSWSFDAEATEVSDDGATLAQPAVTVHKAQGFIPYSIEVGQDYPGFAMELQTLLAEGYSELLVDKFTIGAGDGSNEPFGITVALDGSASEVDTATTNVLAADDINGLWAALPIRYRSNATWMSHTTINNTIQQLGDGDEASFTVDFTAEGVQRLKGREYVLNDYVVSAFATDVKPFLIVGDFSNYLIAQRAGMSVELIPHLMSNTTTRPSGQRGLYAWARVGADSINDKGFRALSDNGT